MTPQIIIAAVIAATGFGAAWKIQDQRFDAKEKAHAEQKLAQIQHNAAAAIRRVDNVITAQNQATARAASLRRDLDSSRSELDRLRDTLRTTVPAVGTSTTSCTERTDPARELLAACATELVEMGGIADRHASDVKTLTDGWPK